MIMAVGMVLQCYQARHPAPHRLVQPFQAQAQLANLSIFSFITATYKSSIKCVYNSKRLLNNNEQYNKYPEKIVQIEYVEKAFALHIQQAKHVLQRRRLFSILESENKIEVRFVVHLTIVRQTLLKDSIKKYTR